jgi:TPR repeat protein
MEWFRKGVDAGDTQCMANIGQMYEDGVGVPKDIPQAISWYRRAITSAKKPDEQGATYARDALKELGAPLQ